MSPPERSIEDLLDDLVEVWHTEPDMGGVELHQFLGMTEAEYGAWVKGNGGAPTPERLHDYWRWLGYRLAPPVQIPEVGGPSTGHTFEIAWRTRGSSSLAFVPGHEDANDWSMPIVGRFRAWNLVGALKQASVVPFERWWENEDGEGS